MIIVDDGPIRGDMAFDTLARIMIFGLKIGVAIITIQIAGVIKGIRVPVVYRVAV